MPLGVWLEKNEGSDKRPSAKYKVLYLSMNSQYYILTLKLLIKSIILLAYRVIRKISLRTKKNTILKY